MSYDSPARSAAARGGKSGGVAVVGHVCVDIIPSWPHHAAERPARILPGALLQVGPAAIATGGAVSNTGIALHRLGVPVTLVGRIGNDLFGDAIIEAFRAAGVSAERLTRSKPDSTSYSVVINPPGVDRTFLHCPGANHAFDPDEVDVEQLAGRSELRTEVRGPATPPRPIGRAPGDAKPVAPAPGSDAPLASDAPFACGGVPGNEVAGPVCQIMHFGYPQAMRGTYADGGERLARMFARARRAGIVTSLDTCFPDMTSDAGRVDWRGFFGRVLPEVDVFAPSWDELMLMLDGQEALDSATELLRGGAAMAGDRAAGSARMCGPRGWVRGAS